MGGLLIHQSETAEHGVRVHVVCVRVLYNAYVNVRGGRVRVKSTSICE